MPKSTSRDQPDRSNDKFANKSANKAAPDLRRQHADGTARHPEYPELEGRTPLPEEITGRASGTNEDLVDLFVNTSDKHLADGFHDSSEDESRDDGEEPTIQEPSNPNIAELPNRKSKKE